MTELSVPVPLYMLRAAHELLKLNETLRFHINCLQVEVKGDAALLIATNGHVLLVQSISLEGDYGNGSFAVPREVLGLFPKVTKSNRDEIYHLSASTVLGPVLSFGWEQSEGDYPDWRWTLPADDYETSLGRYDPRYELLFNKISKILQAQNYQIHPNGERQPALVTFTKPTQAFGVIMPVKPANHPTQKPFEIWEHATQEEAA